MKNRDKDEGLISDFKTYFNLIHKLLFKDIVLAIKDKKNYY